MMGVAINVGPVHPVKPVAPNSSAAREEVVPEVAQEEMPAEASAEALATS